MGLHKDLQGNIHDDMNGTALGLLPVGCVPITQAAADALLAPTTAQIAAEKDAVLARMRVIRETALDRLNGIVSRAVRAGDNSLTAPCDAAAVSLLNITTDAGIVAATDGASTKTAVLAVWRTIAATLTAAAPAAASVFIGLEM
jgi:hypothetical protein